MWMNLYLKMDSLIKCFLFSNVFLFLGHWWRTGGDWDECWSKRRITFPPNWCNSGFKGGRCPGCFKRCESDVTYCQEWWPILGICALHFSHPKCTHTAVNTHTHTPWTHTRSSGQPFMLRRPGSSLVFGALINTFHCWLYTLCIIVYVTNKSWTWTQGHLSRGIEGGESTVHSLPSPTIPAGNLWVTSPTL